MGTIDGSLLPIKAPAQEEHLFVTRRRFNALNNQGICDAQNVFLNILVYAWLAVI